MGIKYGISKIRPAERDRGCVFIERFDSESEVEANGGALVGSPQFSNGLVLDGSTQYGTAEFGSFNCDNGITITVCFTPDFAKNDNVYRHIVDTTTTRYYIFRDNSSNILINASNLNTSVLYADYQAYWKDYAENNLTWVVTPTDFEIFLNGVSVKKVITASWDKKQPTDMIYGARSATYAYKFDGIIHSVNIFCNAISVEEIQAYYNNAMWAYDYNLDTALPMQLRDHQGSTTRNLVGTDVSFSGCTFSNGGYIFDGVDDYMSLPSRSSKYPYIFADSGTGPQFYSGSAANTLYDLFLEPADFTGTLYSLFMYSSELNATQMIDLEKEMKENYYRGRKK